MLVTSIFSFSHNILKRFIIRLVQAQNPMVKVLQKKPVLKYTLRMQVQWNLDSSNVNDP